MSEAEPASPSQRGAQQWLAKAVEDLGVAGIILESATGARWAACFHAQQATEKALKAVLVAAGTDFPRTHVLERLADLLGDVELVDRSVLIDLTPWAVAGRYPEDVPDPTVDDAQRLVASATSAVEAARRHLAKS
jgi:HEPN domain-containing protein